MLAWLAYKAVLSISARVWRVRSMLAAAAFHFTGSRSHRLWLTHGLTVLKRIKIVLWWMAPQRAGQGERALRDVKMWGRRCVL